MIVSFNSFLFFSFAFPQNGVAVKTFQGILLRILVILLVLIIIVIITKN